MENANLRNPYIQRVLAIKRNKSESVVRWVNLELVIQSYQKEKNKYCILTHIYGI